MNIDQLYELLEEVHPKAEDERFIECSESSSYADNNQYKRILAALKQNIELQTKVSDLTTKLEKVEKEGMESLIKIEETENARKSIVNILEQFIEDVGVFIENNNIKPVNNRIGDWEVNIDEEGASSLVYAPIIESEPVELKVRVVENNNKDLCPICKNELGRYPALSRKDNKTKICSNCGMKEALQIWEEASNNEKQNI